MEPVAASAPIVDVDEIVLEALGFNDFARELGEIIDGMASADPADEEAALETGQGDMGEIAADEAEKEAVLKTLGELRESIDKMAKAAAAGGDLVASLGIDELATELNVAVDGVATAAAAGIALLEAGFDDYVLELKKAVDDFAGELEEANAANKAALKSLYGGLEEDAFDAFFGDDEPDHLAIQPVDEQTPLWADEYERQQMLAFQYAVEDAFDYSSSYWQLVYLTDEALKDFRRKASAGSSGSHARAGGFLGRYGFATPQDLLSID